MNVSTPTATGPSEPEDLPRGVTRHEHGRTRGFLVRKAGVRRLFSDGVHGGFAEARAAALEFHASVPVVERSRKRVPGYGYVKRVRVRYRSASGQEKQYDAWQAWFWDAEGKMESTKWSIDEHGSELAERACQAWLDEKRSGLSTAELPELAEAG